jgi:uncharacterized protein (DUF58 family)
VVAKRTQGSGARADRRARRIGAGIDFADRRNYVPGDDVRALDWNLLARLDRPFVRLREEDEDLTLSLIVDASASMASASAGPAKLELALRLAAALAYIALNGKDRVGVAVVAAGVLTSLPAVRGKGNAARVLDRLDAIVGRGRTDLNASVRELLAARGSARRGRTILISDLYDVAGPLPALGRLRAARQDVAVIQIVAASDAAPAGGADGDVIVEDAETGARQTLTLTPAVRRAQIDRYGAWLRGIVRACRERDIPCLQIEATVPFEEAVLRILRAGGLLA